MRLAIGCVAISSLCAWGEPIVVARFAGEALTCVVPPSESREACARQLLETLQARAEAAYVVENALQASAAELAELEAYNRSFEAHDRGQRARKLRELDDRLVATRDPQERARLADFRTTLARLARYESDVDAGLETRNVIPADTLRRWIEAFKLDASLYRRYGGTVGLRSSGPYAHGARMQLLIEYTTAGNLVFLDPQLEHRFHALVAAPPRITLTGGDPDFTPYWRRPIPASYVAD